jgi:flavodoxin
MAKVLALYYSLTGQTGVVMQAVIDALRAGGHDVVEERLDVDPPFSFPADPEWLTDLLRKALTSQWPVLPLKPLSVDLTAPYDVILLGYQPWYLTPSVPIHSFLKSPEASVVSGKAVIGIVSCRAMFGRAGELFKAWVEERGGRLIEQRAFVDQDHRPTNALSLFHYLKYGRSLTRFPFGLFMKPYGVGNVGIGLAKAYGESLSQRLHSLPLQGDGHARALS